LKEEFNNQREEVRKHLEENELSQKQHKSKGATQAYTNTNEVETDAARFSFLGNHELQKEETVSDELKIVEEKAEDEAIGKDIEQKILDVLNEIDNQHGTDDTVNAADEIIGQKTEPDVAVMEEKKKAKFDEKVEQLAERLKPDNVVDIRVVKDHAHEMPSLVTAASQETFIQVLHLIRSVQVFLPKQPIYVFVLDLNPYEKKQVQS
jgi:hypothetical protein